MLSSADRALAVEGKRKWPLSHDVTSSGPHSRKYFRRSPPTRGCQPNRRPRSNNSASPDRGTHVSTYLPLGDRPMKQLRLLGATGLCLAAALTAPASAQTTTQNDSA